VGRERQIEKTEGGKSRQWRKKEVFRPVIGKKNGIFWRV